MTTITARDGVVASDSRETEDCMDVSLSYIVEHKSKKLHRLADGSVFAGAGSTEDIARLLIALKKKQSPPKLDHIGAIRVFSDGKIELYEGNIWMKLTVPFYAVGTGAPYALAAMMAGAGAKEAAKIGAYMDPFSGGRIQTLKVGPSYNKPQPKSRKRRRV